MSRTQSSNRTRFSIRINRYDKHTRARSSQEIGFASREINSLRGINKVAMKAKSNAKRKSAVPAARSGASLRRRSIIQEDVPSTLSIVPPVCFTHAAAVRHIRSAYRARLSPVAAMEHASAFRRRCQTQNARHVCDIKIGAGEFL